MSSFREVKAELDKQAKSDDRRQCLHCQELTDYDTLSVHGGLCFPCFKSYCREPFIQREPSRCARELKARLVRLMSQG